MRRTTWSWAALCACLLATVALAHADNTADDALQPNFLPSSAAKNSLGGVFVEEQATAHAEEGSAAKLLAEIEAQSAAADVAAAAGPAQDDGPPPLSRADAESLTNTLMAALRGADPSQAFHEMMAERSSEDASAAAAAVAAPAPVAEPEETPAFLQQKESATAARMATLVGNKRFEVEDKAEDLSKEPADDKDAEEEEEHPDPYQLHHAQDAVAAAAPAAAAWPYMAAPMMPQAMDGSAAAERFRQMSMMSNPYAALYQAYLQQFSQAGHHHKHRHHHKKLDEDEPADKPQPQAAAAGAGASSSSSGDAMRFKEKESSKASDDDDEEDDDDDGGDSEDDGDADGDDDDDDDGEERRRRERKRKQQQEKLKYDDAMNKMRFEQTQVNLDIENMKSFTSPRQSGYSAPVDATPVAAAPAAPAAIPLGPQAGGAGFRQLFNAPSSPSYAAQYPQAAPAGASAYPSLIALSSTTQQLPAASAVNANPNGVPMPFFPPTSAPPPAPNQVPVAAQVVNGVYPPSMVMPSTAAMPFAADGLTQAPAVNPSAPTMNPNAPSAPGLSNYPFGGTNFLELESQPLPAIHAHVDSIARHPRHPHVRTRLTEQHFEPFPLL